MATEVTGLGGSNWNKRSLPDPARKSGELRLLSRLHQPSGALSRHFQGWRQGRVRLRGRESGKYPEPPKTSSQSPRDEIDPFWGTANVALTFLRLRTVASIIQPRGVRTKERPSRDAAPARRAVETPAPAPPSLLERWHAKRPRIQLTLQYFRDCSTVKAYLITAAVVIIITVVAPLFLTLVRNF